MERVMIFIDGSNLYKNMKQAIGTVNLNFEKFQLRLAGNRTFVRTYYYNASLIKQQDEQKFVDQQKFFTYLKRVPYMTIKFGRLVERSGGFVEKGVDINIAVDMLTFAYNNAYDTAILVSGDGDFVRAVEGVQNLGKHVENACFVKGQSFHLRDVCDRVILLDSEFIAGCN